MKPLELLLESGRAWVPGMRTVTGDVCLLVQRGNILLCSPGLGTRWAALHAAPLPRLDAAPTEGCLQALADEEAVLHGFDRVTCRWGADGAWHTTAQWEDHGERGSIALRSVAIGKPRRLRGQALVWALLDLRGLVSWATLRCPRCDMEHIESRYGQPELHCEHDCGACGTTWSTSTPTFGSSHAELVSRGLQGGGDRRTRRAL